MVALPALDGACGGPAVTRWPGPVRDPGAGEALGAEVYELPVPALGRLTLTAAPPPAIGTVALVDGSAAPGFVCAGCATGADSSAYGGWRRYLMAERRLGVGP